MTRVKHVECDVCHEQIGKGVWARLKMKARRRFRFKLTEWGLTDMSTTETGWRRKRVDLCGDCWESVVGEVRRRVEA